MKNVLKLFLSLVLTANISANAFAGTHSASPKNDVQLLNISILPEDMNDPSIIYIKESLVENQKYASLFYCKNKNDERTCTLLGGKAFTVAKLQEYSNSLKQNRKALLEQLKSIGAESDKMEKIAKNARRFLLASIYIVSVILLTIFNAPGALGSALVVSLLTLVPGGFVVYQGIDFESMIGLRDINKEFSRVFSLAYNDLHSTNEMLQNPQKSYPNLQQVAQSLHEFLLNAENYTNKSRIFNP